MPHPTLNVVFDCSDKSESFPLFCRYPQQHQPQRAFISLDIQTGNCDADYTGIVGNAVPEPVFHGRVLWFDVNPYLSASRISELINTLSDKLQFILNHSEIKWNGSNHVGVLSDEARTICDDIEREVIPDFEVDHTTNLVEDSGDLYDYLSGDIFPPEGKTINDFADEIIANIPSEYAFINAMNHTEGMLSYLSDLWANQLYNGEVLPQPIAQHLIDNGICDDSAWMDELNAMANGTYNIENA